MTAPATAVPHGTAGGYSNHRCRCTDCRAAHAKACADRKKRRRDETPFDQVPHGENGYGNYLCRCPTCKDAHRIGIKKRRDNKRRRLAGGAT